MVVLVRRFRSRLQALLSQANDAEETASGIVGKGQLISLESEKAGRRLSTQIGSTLVGIAEISTESSGAQARAADLLDQVSQGASAMEEINASVESLAKQISEQNALVDQSAAAIEQVSASIESVAKVARDKKEAAQRLANLTETGTETVSVSEKLIGDVDASVKNVTGMIRVINGIAAQTNLLAMNAAIEAAHAGDYGRGFAVVASEIRSLAESTSENAGQISRTLKELGATMTDAQEASQRSGEAFRDIREEAQSVSAAFGEITQSTDELSAGSTQIVEATERLRDISGQTSISAQEMKIGSTEVTEILITAREASTYNSDAMEEIRKSTIGVANASKTISLQAQDINSQVGDVLDLFSVGSEASRKVAVEARQRIEMSAMVLDHMGRIAGVRRSLDQTGVLREDELKDPRECHLGKWLEDKPEELIADPESLERLKQLHTDFHATIAQISEKTVAENGADVSDLFRRMMVLSREITELVASYEEGELTWTPELSVGVDTFDMHHQKLFALISRLYSVMRAGSNKETLEKVFDELLDYTVYHFSAEEQAFDEFGYLDAAEHKQLHAELVQQATALRADLEAGKEMVAHEVMEFLRDWVTNHIMVVDRKYGPHLGDKVGAEDAS